MKRYTKGFKEKVQQLRSSGKTYGEIRSLLQSKIPKSTLSDWCNGVVLPTSYRKRIDELNMQSLGKARTVAVEINKIKREEFFKEILKRNTPIAKTIHNQAIGKIALAMLCLGEASKYNPKSSKAFSLGSSDFRIIVLFLTLLRLSFSSFDIEKIRCTVQCRADQDTEALRRFWMHTTGIPERLFYKPQIDPRTKGKPTKRSNYKGVLRVDYFDTKVQLELESLADLVYNQLRKGPVVYR